MLIAQISDTHVCAPGQLYKGVADSNRMLQEAVQHLQALDCQPDLVLHTGDLVEHGRPEEYAEALRILGGLGLPWLAIPGNHDHRENFRAALAGHLPLPANGPLHYSVERHPLHIVALDVCQPGLHHGQVHSSAADWLRRTLATAPQQPTLLLMHQPPFVSGIPYLDEYRCFDSEALAAVLRDFNHVEAVLCGHVHRVMLRRWAGTLVCTAPSTTTEIALQLAPAAQPQSFMGRPGCLLHLWEEGQGLVSHHSPIGPAIGPFPFF